MTKVYLRLTNEGCGGFLNPPTHPEHNWSLQDRNNMISLSSAVEYDWIAESSRNAAKTKLDSWVRPDINSEIIQDWIHHVLGYFNNCYQAKNGSWNASDLRIRKSWNPLKHINTHAGIRFIRKYYPEFVPDESHFKNAYWGKKK